MSRLLSSNVKHIVQYCGNLKKNEKVLIIYDKSTNGLIKFFYDEITKITDKIKTKKIAEQMIHGVEPPVTTSKAMKESDLIFALTKMSMAHTKARMEASLSGARYLSLAEYSLKILNDKSIKGVNKSNILSMQKLYELFNKGKNVYIESKIGTKVYLDISERKPNFCPGFVEHNGDLGSPPDMEVNVSPQETKTQGLIVVDGSITHPQLGLLQKNVTLEINNGLITNISKNHEGIIFNRILNSTREKKSRVLAELGIGFNKKAKLTGMMLTDEGSAGNIHFGFGSNFTVGGKNNVSFHIDVVIKFPFMKIDGKKIIEKGKIII